jgi:hypothetical protein
MAEIVESQPLDARMGQRLVIFFSLTTDFAQNSIFSAIHLLAF